MKKRGTILAISIIILLVLVFGFYLGVFDKLTGGIISEQNSGSRQNGPSAEEQNCMMSCMGCTSPGVGCTGNKQECQTKCNVQKPEETEETSCMEKCVSEGCDKFDFSCQSKNQAVCEKQCNMLRDKTRRK